jgi:hypothetical protein
MPGFHQSEIIPMDLKIKDCQELNNKLAFYRAFGNHPAAAAVIREMANHHCPIKSSEH